MQTYKLALLGAGRLSEIVAQALEAGQLPGFSLAGVLGRSPQHTQAFAARHGCTACESIGQLMALQPDFVAEAASVEAIRQHSEAILSGGASLVVLSIGAFADEGFYKHIADVAAQNSTRVYIASGAVGGFDVLRTASLMGPVTASISAKKMPRALAGTPLDEAGLADITAPKQLFTGSARQAIGLLPTKVNVAVATALASAGPENTTMHITAYPGFEGDEYKIEVAAGNVRTDLNIYSGTSDIAGYSVVAALRNATSPIVF